MATLKQLESELGSLEKEYADAKVVLSVKQLDLNKLAEKINAVKIQIKNSIPENPVVSEHVMLRYFERILGYDLKEIESGILTEKVVNQIKVLRDAQIPVEFKNGIKAKLVVKNNVIVTLKLG